MWCNHIRGTQHHGQCLLLLCRFLLVARTHMFFVVVIFVFWQRHEARFRAGGCARASSANARSTNARSTAPGVVTGVVTGPVVATVPVQAPNARNIARRVPFWIPSLLLARERIILQHNPVQRRNHRDISQLQFQWRAYCSVVRKLCNSAF